MGILEEIAKRAMAPKLKKSFEKAWEIAKDDPELVQALKDLEGYHERLDEVLYTQLESLGKDHPKYDPVEQAKRRERIEARKVAEEKEKHKLFDSLIDYNFFCDKSYWLKQDIKDLIQITTYLKKVGPLEIDGLSEFFEEFIKKNNDTNLFFKPTILKDYKSVKSSLKEDQLKIELVVDKINSEMQWDNVIVFIAPHFIFTKNSLYVLKMNEGSYSKKLKPYIPGKVLSLNYFLNFESIKFEKFKKKDKAFSFSKELFLTSCVLGFIIGWIGWGISFSFFGLLIGALLGILTGFNFDQEPKLIYNEIESKNSKYFTLKLTSHTSSPEKTKYINQSIDLFEKIKPDLKEFLEIYKKEHIKIAPKLLEKIKKLIKN